MFEKFGRMKTVDELNNAAAGFLEEGDRESLFALAKENGIDHEDAEDYADGLAQELASLRMAAMGRTEVWYKEYAEKNENAAERMAMKVIIAMLQTMVREDAMAAAVLAGDDPNGIYKALGDGARRHMTGTGNNRMAVSCGTDQELRGIIRTYYLEPKKLRAKIEALYAVEGGAKA